MPFSLDTSCPECGSDKIIGREGDDSATVECEECGHTATARRTEDGRIEVNGER